MVTMASLLLAPLIWVHYLVVLALPAALLAARGYRWAILLPLLGWLPEPALPLVAIAGAYLPLLAGRRPAASAEALTRDLVQVCSTRQRPSCSRGKQATVGGAATSG